METARCNTVSAPKTEKLAAIGELGGRHCAAQWRYRLQFKKRACGGFSSAVTNGVSMPRPHVSQYGRGRF